MSDLFPNIFSDDNSYLSLKDDVVWSITSYKFVVDTIDVWRVVETFEPPFREF